MREVPLSDERSAALLVRVWLEGGTDRFRARVSAVGPDGAPDHRTIAVAASPSEVLDAVRHWLDRFLSDGTATD